MKSATTSVNFFQRLFFAMFYTVPVKKVQKKSISTGRLVYNREDSLNKIFMVRYRTQNL